jgi:uncharacterized small protein (DUF1192 family)
MADLETTIAELEEALAQADARIKQLEEKPDPDLSAVKTLGEQITALQGELAELKTERARKGRVI